mmetsp:Transcript_10280/g.23173  ORF Transcript_10280/g.23173 Transcript_10280/m.23173 type:complete len:215 (+) Transcript_10280:67-711(+)|eukprot:CAMPEP_0197940074 /NCGR_PEP_ID=MMETSP1439-20131203/120640_1 /TAXON_ID=66791 /ORGANISM="Gonyaulax spinifera, Strain CCMP409" /LENGTH=214 /DNA_ID=CAMNT_0043563223 /DNA_START=43 /DNA_END=687 /DNA_ORIENTATION=-
MATVVTVSGGSPAASVVETHRARELVYNVPVLLVLLQVAFAGARDASALGSIPVPHVLLAPGAEDAHLPDGLRVLAHQRLQLCITDGLTLLVNVVGLPLWEVRDYVDESPGRLPVRVAVEADALHKLLDYHLDHVDKGFVDDTPHGLLGMLEVRRQCGIFFVLGIATEHLDEPQERGIFRVRAQEHRASACVARPRDPADGTRGRTAREAKYMF